MTSFGVVLIVAAALSVQIIQTSTQVHKKKHRCVSLRPGLPQPELETRSRTLTQKSQYSASKSPPTVPLSKSSSTVSAKSSDSVIKSPSPEQKLSQSVARSLNAASKLSADSFTLFKLPLQLISKLLSPLLPSTTRRNTSSVIAPVVSFNMPLTFSTIHSSNPVPCKTNSPVPCNTQPETTINIPYNQQPCNIINNPPSSCNDIQPGTTNNIPIPCNPLPCKNNSVIPCVSKQNEPNSSYHNFIYQWLCGFLLNNINTIRFCNTTNQSHTSAVTSTVNPPTTTSTDSPITDDILTTTTIQTDDLPTTTTHISNPPSSTSPKSTTTEESIPPTTTKPKCATKDKSTPCISTTPKCPSNEPVLSTPLTTELTSDEPNSAFITVHRCKTHKPHKPCLPPIHLSKPISFLPHTSNTSVICRHRHSPASLKLHPPDYSSLEIFKPLFKSMNYKSYDQNSQDLLLKLISSLTSNMTTSIPTNI